MLVDKNAFLWNKATESGSDCTFWHCRPASGVNIMVFVIVFQTAGVLKPLRKAAYYLLLKTLYILCTDLYRRGKNINISSFHTIVDITPVPVPDTKIPAERSKCFFFFPLRIRRGKPSLFRNSGQTVLRLPRQSQSLRSDYLIQDGQVHLGHRNHWQNPMWIFKHKSKYNI
jgi:hypothetical protein